VVTCGTVNYCVPRKYESQDDIFLCDALQGTVQNGNIIVEDWNWWKTSECPSIGEAIVKHSIFRLFGRLQEVFPHVTEEPIRSELFSIERLEQHAESLATAQRVTAKPAVGGPLAARLIDNGRVLHQAYRTIAKAVSEEQVIMPAAEWLVDNFHVVDEQIREIHDDLPRSYYRQLPKLAEGPLKGYPRVFGIAWAFVAHTDSRFDVETLIRFVRAYQRVQPLTIGELWAVAITLRIVLVENLRRSAQRIVTSRVERQEANVVADRLLGVSIRDAEQPDVALRQFLGLRVPTAFAAQLVQRLRDQDPAVTPALRWLDERLTAQGTTSEKIVNEEHQFQGAMSVTVRNVITSMRLMSSIDWRKLFESVSLVDEVLREKSNFAAMDFPTRDSYRHAIEVLARGSGRSEIEVTQNAIQKAQEAKGNEKDSREQDPGYYLLSKGRPAFEKQIAFDVPLRLWLNRAAAGTGMRGYLVTIAFVIVFILALPLLGVAKAGASGYDLFLLTLLAVIPLSDLAVALVNHWITNRFGPKALPGLELRDGVPSSLRTMVVMPTLLTTREEIEEQIERLEVHFLANQGGDLRFALLSDWTDSATESAEGDDKLLGVAIDGIALLNRRHESMIDGERFLLLHRRRLWSEGEEKWMGWERKRGKLHELNRLLRGATDTSFLSSNARRSPVSSSVPSGVRFVITLDADTRLPRRAARRLVGKMAHPLNQPTIDVRTGLVIEGHAVLQPRVTPALPMGRAGSFFQHIFSGPGGMDPYAFVVSDVYQDLFGEGSYSGKGIYDVDVFEAALQGRIPENSVLSHDLLEGIFAGSGLVSDIEVVEEFPTRYDVAAARQHRWARGDWQLLPWILGHGRSSSGQEGRRKIPLTGRWKMIDNLRRSLSVPAAFLALLGGWTLPIASASVWSAFVLATIALPPLLPFFMGIVPRRRQISKRSHVRAAGRDLSLALSQIGFHIALLADQAWLMTDAILRTLFRMFVSHRHMLEWVTAAQAKFGLPLNILGFYRRMAGCVALSCFAGIMVAFGPHESWLIAAPFIVLWMLSPLVAQRASRPQTYDAPKPITIADTQKLQLIARRTWRFFETFVTAKEHNLPPDNFQEEPKPTLAHRTSPTNLGLYLLSTIAAHDFGWLGMHETAERLDATLTAMNGLERFRGHFYNWYDTHDLRPLDPKYISTVDSGNLAGHLIAVGNACSEMIARPLMDSQWTVGIVDTLMLIRESLRTFDKGRRTQTVNRKGMDGELHIMSASLVEVPMTPAGIVTKLEELASHAKTLTGIVRSLIEESGGDPNAESGAELFFWTEAMQASIKSHERDAELLKPWALLARAAKSDPGIVPQDTLGFLVDSIPTLADFPDRCEEATSIMTTHQTKLRADGGRGGSSLAQVEALMESFRRSCDTARSLQHRLSSLKEVSIRTSTAMDFKFLFDAAKQLLSIGYRVADGYLDPSCYDLLASEARLASFVAIAKGDVPVRNWFHLGRSLTPVDRGSALISWSGSMFEYLMPSLVMRAPAESLIGQTIRLVVRRQIEYGGELGVPWGVSESAYNVRDLEFTYQYSNFGVPGLGLKRGLIEDAVIAPYATGLAAMVDPRAAAENYARLAEAGGCGKFGFYEALDYTPSRLPEGASVVIVRTYMVHHQGMTLVAIGNTLHDGAMCARFHAEPIVKATELLLQERTPRDVSVTRPRTEEVNAAVNVRDLIPPIHRRFHSPHDRVPSTHILSNGNYAVMITGAGSGYSRWRDLAVTRWREDVTCDSWGSYIFLRDTRSGTAWSAGYQPTAVEPDSYEVEFSEDLVEIARRDGTIATTLEVAVSPESDAEVRRVSISNLGNRVREIELTSYAEVVLTQPASDMAHPAFSKLFIQTEFVTDVGTLIATRRRRSPDEPEIWAAHLAVIEGESVGEVQYESDRSRFLGRGEQIRTPISVMNGKPLSNTAGTVLDPIFSLRCRVRILPGTTVRVAFWTMVAPSRTEVLDLADKHHDPTAFERAVTLAWTQAQVQLNHLGIGAEEAHLFQRLASHILYSNPALRPPSEVLKRSESGQSTLWAHRISGDLPIVLVRIDEPERLEIVRQLLRAHEYWRMKLLAVDLVILNEQPQSYTMDLQGALETVLRTNESQLRPQIERKAAQGNIFLLRADLVSIEVRMLLQSSARVVLLGRRGSLSEQINSHDALESAPSQRRISFPLNAKDWVKDKLTTVLAENVRKEAVPPPEAMEFSNGLGGFTADGSEYVTILSDGQCTPAPWINVIANPTFGFQVSAEGAGYTWSMNSRENQLTPWSNDPVADRSGEVLYIRDEQSGTLWSPTALPIREANGQYIARHGQGYTRFEHTSHGISLELFEFVPLKDSIKISRLKIKNNSRRNRRLSITAYIEWVLAASREASAPFISTEVDPVTGAMFARNPWRTEFRNRVAFADLAGRHMSWTGDRKEFLGRNGTLDHPAALANGDPLSNHVGAGLDPCCALQTRIELKPGEQTEIIVFLGEAATKEEAQSLISRFRTIDLNAVFRDVTTFWSGALGAVQVKTPDRSMDLLLNRWLLYQTMACRVWARSAFYQASGAYGFRDQLQDGMALAVSMPTLTREHLLRAAGRQFVEGDFQHWWLPSTGRGDRTRISDDRVWLPYTVTQYIEVTNDLGILDEMIPYLEGPVLRAGERDSFFQPMISGEEATLFEHCARALDHSLSCGVHGLPLIGTGDWNDGMNMVGEEGKGESVWLGWFLHATLSRFAPLANTRGENKRATAWLQHAVTLQASLDRDAWDGAWYIRGYYDDGTPLGSASSEECRIDSIVQSWAVISGVANPARAAKAMAAVDEYLIRRSDGLVLLFTPPFDRTPRAPGYIKGYPPGIRENGGQYTHGAIWSVIAYAMLGDGDKAGEVFSMLNPINRSSNRAAIDRYKVEPYVVCADVYSESPHVGHGGWTWYTGSAGWMYRAGLEWILGFRIQGTMLLLDPCVPKTWQGFEIVYRYRSARYEIAVENPDGVSRGIRNWTLDGVLQSAPTPGNSVQMNLVDDGGTHHVHVTLGVFK
jgi:cyclic beta-1,2-glucan synthetase